ncbi:MAG: M20/M25/M40 family metallo-hydrolase, partial [Candidatus Omnitrophota bacterium]
MINRKRLIALTQRLIQIDSQNPPGNELEIVKFVREYLNSFGLKSKIYEFAGNRPNIICLLRSDSLHAKTILISPHLDTVPAGRGWKYPPLKGIIKGGRIYGRGATDCKGNLAVAIEVLNSLLEDKSKIRNSILFAATADEETGSGLGLIP